MDERLEKIKADLEEWKAKHPALAFSIATGDADYLISLAQMFLTAKLCKCP